MVGKPAWRAGVCYVDLFAGPGVCKIESTNERIPGSPLIAANSPKPFTKILLCEKDRELATACEQRLRLSPAKNRFRVFCGDCNVEVDRIVKDIPQGALTLAFLDPTGLHLHFETIKRLAEHGPVDLLILFPDAVDAMRNVDYHYFDNPESKLDQVLGLQSNWRQLKAELVSPDAARKRQLFVKIYKYQLRKHAGYEFFADEVILGNSGPLYRLVFATKHQQGIDFWKKSTAKEFSGQKRMFDL